MFSALHALIKSLILDNAAELLTTPDRAANALSGVVLRILEVMDCTLSGETWRANAATASKSRDVAAPVDPVTSRPVSL